MRSAHIRGVFLLKLKDEAKQYQNAQIVFPIYIDVLALALRCPVCMIETPN